MGDLFSIFGVKRGFIVFFNLFFPTVFLVTLIQNNQYVIEAILG